MSSVIDDIRSCRQKIKTLGRMETNAFSDDVFTNVEEFYSSEKSILVSCFDCGVKRLYYYTADVLALNCLFQSLKFEEYVLEILTKNPDDKKTFLKENGFELLAQMMRMSTRDCSSFLNDSVLSQYGLKEEGEVPETKFAPSINERLHEIFDSRVSHLLSDDELIRSIERGEVEIHCNGNGAIDAILQVVVKPQNFYINQIYNGSEKRIIHAMLQKRLKKYIAQGGKYAYAWVEKDNVASIKFHEKYGFKFDGLWNMVYVLKK